MIDLTSPYTLNYVTKNIHAYLAKIDEATT